MSGKTKREIKAITDDILKTLKVIDNLGTDDTKSTSEKKEVKVDLETLKKLRKTSNDIKNDIAFFVEGKKLASEALEEVKNGDISTREKTKVINFVNSNYEKEKHIKDDPSDIDQKRLTKILNDFIKDADKYIDSLNKKLEGIEESITAEEEGQVNLRKDALKEKLSGNLDLIQEKGSAFDRELEKLRILEDELSLAIMERDNQKQIDDTRKVLNQKID